MAITCFEIDLYTEHEDRSPPESAANNCPNPHHSQQSDHSYYGISHYEELSVTLLGKLRKQPTFSRKN